MYFNLFEVMRYNLMISIFFEEFGKSKSVGLCFSR